MSVLMDKPENVRFDGQIRKCLVKWTYIEEWRTSDELYSHYR